MDNVVKKRLLIFIFASICLVLPLRSAWLERVDGEQLFFAMQVEDGERVIARPRLLGESGHTLTMNLVERDRPHQVRLALQVLPERNQDESYNVQIKLTLPDRAEEKSGKITIRHGEERKVEIADSVRPITVRLLVMRVVSPEFDSYMKLSQRGQRRTS